MSYVPSFIQILLLFFKLSQISSVLQGFPTHGSKRVFWNLNNYITLIKLNKSTYFLLTYVSLDIRHYNLWYASSFVPNVNIKLKLHLWYV